MNTKLIKCISLLNVFVLGRETDLTENIQFVPILLRLHIFLRKDLKSSSISCLVYGKFFLNFRKKVQCRSHIGKVHQYNVENDVKNRKVPFAYNVNALSLKPSPRNAKSTLSVVDLKRSRSQQHKDFLIRGVTSRWCIVLQVIKWDKVFPAAVLRGHLARERRRMGHQHRFIFRCNWRPGVFGVGGSRRDRRRSWCMRHVFKAGKYWTIGLRIEDIIGPSFRRSSTLEFPMRDRQ